MHRTNKSKVFFVYYQRIINFLAKQSCYKHQRLPVWCQTATEWILQHRTHAEHITKCDLGAPKHVTKSHRIGRSIFGILGALGMPGFSQISHIQHSKMLRLVYFAPNNNNKAKQLKRNFSSVLSEYPRRQAEASSVHFGVTFTYLVL